MSSTITKRRQILDMATPLSEKLKHHYQSRDFTVQPTSASKAGITITAFMNFTLLFEALVILLPGLYSNGHERMARTGWFGEGFWLMLASVIFLWVEFTWNWWRVYYDVPNWVTKELKATHFGQRADTPLGWKHCPICLLDAPPRSHHCSHCGHCILKRDHHCFFTSSCVGYHTQRHFVVFCVYTSLSSALAIYLQLAYLDLSLPLPETGAMYIPPLPLYQLCTHAITFSTFLLFLHMYATVFLMVVAVVFLVWQLIIISRGQTSYEALKMIRVHNEGFIRNIVSTFGPPVYSWILLFAPLLLPLEADGAQYTNEPEKMH